jgi:hypothetical protein
MRAAHDPSAKADIALSQPRIHSPGPGGSRRGAGLVVRPVGASKLAATTAESPANRAGLHRHTAACVRHTTRRRRPTSRCPSREFIRLGPGGSRRAQGWWCAPRERVNSPQRLRKPRKLRGASPAHRGMRAAHDPSAKADIALSQPRIHSPGPGGSWRGAGLVVRPAGASELAATTAESPANRAGLHRHTAACVRHTTRRRRPTSRCPSREFIRLGPGGSRRGAGLAVRPAGTGRPGRPPHAP